MRRVSLSLSLTLPLAAVACSDDGTETTLVPTTTLTDLTTETGDGDGDPGDGDPGDGDGDPGDGDGDPGDGDGDPGDGDPGDGDGDPGDGDGDPCVAGTEGCACDNGTCDAGLNCVDDVCAQPSCGDGIVDPGEDCDVGNETMFCDADCTYVVCGDGYWNMLSEQCDDGNMDDTDACVGPCLNATCGDGFIYEGVEECDDNNMIATDECTDTCTVAICGDGVIWEDMEECDDSNMDETDACNGMCQNSFCGDGVIWQGMETCDDGNMDDTDACPACDPAFCGDGFLQLGVEQCDDGNMDDTDDCTNNCIYVGPDRSCKYVYNQNPNSPNGVYEIDPDAGGPNPPRMVYCDMTTDGGGWTLVASTRTNTLDDAASTYYTDLQTINPAAAHAGVWDGMRGLIQGNSDIRFTCMQDPNANAFTVDLSFYDIIWYEEITTGTDADSCFSEGNGANDDQPTPARRDNIANTFLMANDQWTAGYLEGEDACTDTGDFTVDFDDRGMDSNQSDGTDWGEDDSAKKCGTSGLGDGAWHIWVREL